MQHLLILGSAVRCTDGKAGTIGGLLINPNRNHVDYVILNPGLLGGREYFVPSGRIEGASAGELTLPFAWDELENLPRPEIWTEQGTVQDNLSDLCMARADTPVQDANGAPLGLFHGAAIDPNFEIQSIILGQAPEQAIPIARLARSSSTDAEIVVHLAQQAGLPSGAT